MVDQKYYCPTCGQPMKNIEKKPDVFSSNKNNIQTTHFTKELFEIWRCLNCNKEWRINIEKGTLEKRAISNNIE